MQNFLFVEKRLFLHSSLWSYVEVVDKKGPCHEIKSHSSEPSVKTVKCFAPACAKLWVSFSHAGLRAQLRGGRWQTRLSARASGGCRRMDRLWSHSSLPFKEPFHLNPLGLGGLSWAKCKPSWGALSMTTSLTGWSAAWVLSGVNNLPWKDLNSLYSNRAKFLLNTNHVSSKSPSS